jgi:hypothetical protein
MVVHDCSSSRQLWQQSEEAQQDDVGDPYPSLLQSDSNGQAVEAGSEGGHDQKNIGYNKEIKLNTSASSSSKDKRNDIRNGIQSAECSHLQPVANSANTSANSANTSTKSSNTSAMTAIASAKALETERLLHTLRRLEFSMNQEVKRGVEARKALTFQSETASKALYRRLHTVVGRRIGKGNRMLCGRFECEFE